MLSPELFPQRISRSSAMIVATVPSISDTLPDDLHDTLTELMYHANRVRAGQKTMISYEEQIEVEKRIMNFINSIDTSEVE